MSQSTSDPAAALGALIGQTLSGAGKLCEGSTAVMFGELDWSAAIYLTGFTLDLHCSWRFRQNAKIVLGSDDLFRDQVKPAFESMFERKKDGYWVDPASHMVVHSVNVSPTGDLTLGLSDGWVLETFLSAKGGLAWTFRTRSAFVCMDL